MVPTRIKPSWWESVTLFREPGLARGRVVELFRGELFEAVHRALEQPQEDQRRLFVIFTWSKRRADWPEIMALAEKPDFPALI